MLLEEKLRCQTNLSPGEKNVADHILSLGKELKRYSTRNLADISYTSPPTVIRLCKKMGYSGFDQLKDQYLRELEYLEQDFGQVDVNFPFDCQDTLSFVAIFILTPVIVTEDKIKGFPMDNLSASGLLLCILATCLAVEILHYCLKKGWTIKMPDSLRRRPDLYVPDSSKAFAGPGKHPACHHHRPGCGVGDLVLWNPRLQNRVLCDEPHLVLPVSGKRRCL